jgi:hypothetical protein
VDGVFDEAEPMPAATHRSTAILPAGVEIGNAHAPLCASYTLSSEWLARPSFADHPPVIRRAV